MDKDKNRANQAAFKQRRNATHEQRAYWIDKEILQRLEAEALRRGLLNTAGRNSGKANMQAIVELALQVGIETLEKDN